MEVAPWTGFEIVFSSLLVYTYTHIYRLHFYDSMIFVDKRATKEMERMKCGDYWIDV